MEIPLLGAVNVQSALAEVEQKWKILMESHLYTDYRPYSDFDVVESLGRGKYGKVEKVKDKKSGKVHAWKMMVFEKGKLIPQGVQRELNILRGLKHENIARFNEIIGGPSVDVIYILMEYCESTLSQVMTDMDVAFVQTEVKCILQQIFKALVYMHKCRIIHGDINPSNILMKDCSIVKICDFSSAHSINAKSPPPSPCSGNLWYRAPELIFGSSSSTASDIWSSGCIFAELLTLRALFPGKNEMHQITLIIDLLGTPNESTMPGMSEYPLVKEFALKIQPYNYSIKKFKDMLKQSGIDIMSSMLTYCPERRITAEECVEDSYFKQEPAACSLPNLKCGIISKTNTAFAARR